MVRADLDTGLADNALSSKINLAFLKAETRKDFVIVGLLANDTLAISDELVCPSKIKVL